MQDPNGVDRSGLKPPIQIPQSPIQNPNPPSKSPNPQSKIQIPHPNPPPVQIPHPNPPSKSASSIPATCGRKLGTDFWRGVLLENELRFPAPCRGNRGSISGETTGQVVLLKPLSVDIARRRPCVKNCKHRVASTVCEIPCACDTSPGRRLTGASLFNISLQNGSIPIYVAQDGLYKMGAGMFHDQPTPNQPQEKSSIK